MAHAFPEEILFAAEALRRGEIIAYPTETFYGLAVNALDELALARLRQLKGRDEKAISVLVLGNEMIERLCRQVPATARKLMARHWPGPLTIALPARRGIPAPLIQDGYVAIRESPHPTARALVEVFRRPDHGDQRQPRWRAAARARPRRSRSYSRGAAASCTRGATPGGAPSTLVRVRGSRVEVLRQGALVLAAD